MNVLDAVYRKISNIIEANGLSVMTNDKPENRDDIIFTSSTDYNKLTKAMRQVSSDLGQRVVFYKYTPMSGNMNLRIIGVKPVGGSTI